jgi:hypothetical protein
MPLHITANYNGQNTGQTGVHSRYESQMIGRYESQLVYTPDSAGYIDDVSDYVFSYLYTNYNYVDSVLAADHYADSAAGSTSSDLYYQTLWQQSGGFTIGLMSNASTALASLIYTAWVNAGSPVMYPVGTDEKLAAGGIAFGAPYPNPTRGTLHVPVELPSPMQVSVEMKDSSGRTVHQLPEREMAGGKHTVRLNLPSLPAGVYYLELTAPGAREVRKVLVY